VPASSRHCAAQPRRKHNSETGDTSRQPLCFRYVPALLARVLSPAPPLPSVDSRDARVAGATGPVAHTGPPSSPRFCTTITQTSRSTVQARLRLPGSFPPHSRAKSWSRAPPNSGMRRYILATLVFSDTFRLSWQKCQPRPRAQGGCQAKGARTPVALDSAFSAVKGPYHGVYGVTASSTRSRPWPSLSKPPLFLPLALP
jgi:hypothetical protein